MQNSESSSRSNVAFAVFISILLTTTGILFYPGIFNYVLAFGDLLIQDIEGLRYTSVFFFTLGIFIFLFRKKIHPGPMITVFICLMLIWFEFGFRIVVKTLASDNFKKGLTFQSNVTYPESQAYMGSPFLHFTGKPNSQLEGNLALTATHPYNNYGFMGKDFFYYKPSNVVRVACIGESTTADGYPLFLENYLNANINSPGIRFEVYNFGHAYWTTAHSLTNFMLNVVDFSPDLLVIHHGWNEGKIRNYDEDQFRGDYSHRFKSFDSPFVLDRWIIRVSGIYRFFKFLFDKSPHWMSLAGNIEHKNKQGYSKVEHSKELAPYKRNIENIIRIARVNNMAVVLVTIPYSVDSNIAMHEGRPNIIQCNNITRDISTAFGEKVLLCDVDYQITGKRNDIFIDLGHVNDAGRKLKAEFIGKMIYSICDSSFYTNLSTSDKGYSNSSGVKYYIERMKHDSIWYNNDLLIKANKSGLPIEDVMLNDAQFLVEQDRLKGK